MVAGRWRVMKQVWVMLWVLMVIAIVKKNEEVMAQTARDSRDFCTRFALSSGYFCKEYKVQTDDGFILAMHRLGNWGPLGLRRQPADIIEDPLNLTPTKMTSASEPFIPNEANYSPPSEFPFQVSKHSSSEYSATATTQTDIRLNLQKSLNSMELESNDISPSSVPPQADSPTYKETVTSSPEIAPSGASGPVGPEPVPQNDTESEAGRPSTSPPTISTISTLEHLNASGVPILLMHQEFLNGDSWFLHTDQLETDELLPLMLVEEGYDVWVGHQRATFWGHDHATLQPDSREYWNWTWDQHAQFDLPALLGLINIETNRRIHYVGVSQSATVGAAAATRVQVADLMRSLTLIGPTAYRGNTDSIVLAAWAYLIGNTIDSRYYQEGFQNGAFNFTAEFPFNSFGGQGPIAALMNTISGPNCCLGSTVVTFDNGWDGTTSFKNLLHFQQGVRTNSWSHYDYGSPQANMVAYKGQETPPIYNPGDIPARLPVLVIYGDKDETVSPAGMDLFISNLKPFQSFKVEISQYAHFDLSFSVNRTTDIYYPILNFLANHAGDSSP